MIFSFHIDAEDEISCYLWYQGQCIRFLPDDIDTVLPEIFVSSLENHKFITRRQQKKSDKIRYYDRHFHRWYTKMSTNDESFQTKSN